MRKTNLSSRFANHPEEPRTKQFRLLALHERLDQNEPALGTAGRFFISNRSRGSSMKVISRRENEGLVIGEDIFVTVLQVRLNHVRLAISCSRLTPSYWEETLSWEPREESAELQLAGSRF